MADDRHVRTFCGSFKICYVADCLFIPSRPVFTLVLSFLHSFIRNLFNKTAFSINDVLVATSKTGAWRHRVILTNTDHNVHDGSVQLVFGILRPLISLPLNGASDVVVQKIQIRRAGRPHVKGHVIIKLFNQPLLGHGVGVGRSNFHFLCPIECCHVGIEILDRWRRFSWS